MADDEYIYLQPDFDPGSLTVPRLRSILVAHNVAYPSSAKKSDLIALFNQNVVPQARKLLSAQARTKRSTRGIEDVPSSQASTQDDDHLDDDRDEIRVAAATPARRSTRRATTRPSPEAAVEPTPRSTRKSVVPSTASRRASSRHATVDYEPTPRQRKTLRPSFQNAPPEPAPVLEPETEPVYHVEGAESPFTQDNPFQSGSSPPSAYRSKSGDRRRTTMGHSTDRERAKSRDARDTRRRTEAFARRDDGDRRVTRLKFEPDEEDHGVAATEEFTPEEQLDLVKAQEESPQTALSRIPRKTRPRSGVAKAAPLTVLLTIMAGVAAVWRQEKLQVGYCGVGESSSSFGGVDIPEWASFVQPQCEPCPQHAYCYPALKTVCEPDFVLTQHPLSLGGLIPLPPTCEPDSEKVHKIKALADFAVETEMRTRNADYECDERPTPDISESELRQTVAKRARRMTDEEFNELWGPAMGEIVGREEVTSRVDEQTSVRYLRSTSLARVPLNCAIRRSIRLTLRQHLPKLVAVILLSLSTVYGNYALTTRRKTSAEVKRLAGLSLDKLAMQATLHVQDPVGYPEPLLSMVALRDDVLRQEFSAKNRNKLWTGVQALVESNSNVRVMVRESSRTGDVARMWEWTGALQHIEGSSRRQSGGIGRLAGSPRSMIEGVTDASVGSESELVTTKNKWEEQRPYY